MSEHQKKVALQPENVLLLSLSGSRARQLNKVDSDYDYRGVFTLPVGYDWMLDESALDHFKGEGEDETYDHVRKYCKLLVKPSPEHHETLWVTPKQATWAGHMLRSLRWRLTSKKLAYKFAVAAGLLEVERVDEYLQSDKRNFASLGKGGLVNRGVKYYRKARNADNSEDRALYTHESNKALMDTVRRLMVAVEMLRCHDLSADFDQTDLNALPAWRKVYGLFGDSDVDYMDEGWLFNPDFDSTLSVVLPEAQRKQLMRMRNGDMEYELMLVERNWWLNVYHEEMQASRLKEEMDVKPLQYFLQYMSTAQDAWRRGVEQMKAGEAQSAKLSPFWE